MEREYIAEWFRFAEMDLATAEYLKDMRPQPLEIICFHCQQSAEKSLKGYLISKTFTEQSKTHDLIFLNSICTKIDEHFNYIDKACGTLTRYGVQPRYPQEIRITEQDTLKAIEYAHLIWEFKPLADVRLEVNKHDDDLN